MKLRSATRYFINAIKIFYQHFLVAEGANFSQKIERKIPRSSHQQEGKQSPNQQMTNGNSN